MKGLLIGPLGAIGAVVGMTAGELLLAGLAWRALLARREPRGALIIGVDAPLARRSG